jgi:hypothetical protein
LCNSAVIFFPRQTNPSFARLDCDLNLRIARIDQEFAMLVDHQERHSSLGETFFDQLRSRGIRSFIDSRNNSERTTGFEDFPHFPRRSPKVTSRFRMLRFVEQYCGLKGTFECRSLPRQGKKHGSYQLTECSRCGCAQPAFLRVARRRRPDLIEFWYGVMQCIRSATLRTRCKVLTWQELAQVLPTRLQEFLDLKYGIRAT